MATNTVLGVNLGSSFVSAAILTNEGHADILVDQDGQRQFAEAISFNGDEEYVGNEARKQLVTNSSNTILSFRDYLGKPFSQAAAKKLFPPSAPLVESESKCAFSVKARDEPLVISVHEVAVRFLSYIYSSAEHVFGQKASHVAFAVPSDFSQSSIEALKAASAEAGLTSIQVIPMSEAALFAYDLDDPLRSSTKPVDLSRKGGIQGVDRNTVVLDVGAASTTVSVFASRDGLHVPLSKLSDSALGGDDLDAKLADFFSKEFTKKTKVTIDPKVDTRSMIKLHLAVEETKRTLSASTSATCSVESVKEGLDHHGNITRLRFDLLARSVYDRIVELTTKAVKEAGLDVLQVDNIILAGATTRMPSLTNSLLSAFGENTIVLSSIQPDELLAKGAVLYAAKSIATPSTELPLTASLSLSSDATFPTLSKPVGLSIPNPKISEENQEDVLFVPLLKALTPLPARRIFSLQAGEGEGDFAVQLWEGTEEIKVTKPEPKPKTNEEKTGDDDEDDEDDEEEEEEEEEEIRSAITRPTGFLGQLSVPASSQLKLTITVEKDGKGMLEVPGVEPLYF